MKNVFASVSSLEFENPSPSEETKKSLDDLFHQTHPKAAPVWYMSALAVIAPKEKPFYRQPVIQVAAIGLMIFLLSPLFFSDVVQENNQIAQVETLDADSEKMNEGEVEVVPVEQPIVGG